MYVAVLCVGALAAVAMTVGLYTRAATTTVFAVVTYNLFLSTTNVHNNRVYLVVVLAALAVAPSGRELSVDAWRRGRAGMPHCRRRRRRGRCGCCASKRRSSTGRPG